MKLFVTGGLGFIGSRFSIHALEQGHEVKIFDLETYAADLSRLGPIANDVQIVRGDIRDTDLVKGESHGFDVIVNFAAESHNDNAISGPTKFYETNVMGVLSLAQVALEQDIHLHQVSTDEVFGDTPRNSSEKFSESSPLRPSNPYSASKAAAEHLVRAWGRTFGLGWSISNCSNNYGPGQHHEKLIPRSIKLAKAGLPIELYGDGGQIRDWIHVDDHVRGILSQLVSGKLQVALFGASNERTNLEIATAILSALNLSERAVKLVGDRPGHDQRYSIDWGSSREKLAWAPEHLDVIEWISRNAGNI